MELEQALALVAAVGVFAYLIAALFDPEAF